MQSTKLNLKDKLPLTCSRSGTCCHGNLVTLNPWELAQLAKEKKVGVREFRNLYTDYGGIRLIFDGKTGWKNKKACSQYVENCGCSVHVGRPLACRLFPLSREIQNDKIYYTHQGDTFPCLDGCAEVTKLPYLSVDEYLKGQKTEEYERAQNEYLNLMQSLADIAFMLLLDTGLAESGDKQTLPLWRKMGNELPENLATRIGSDWIDCLMTPNISENTRNPVSFAEQHTELLQLKAQEEFGTLQTNAEFQRACILIMGVALYLARGLGANPETLVEHWIGTAKEHGAVE